eukprot:gene24356-9971_t
MVACPEQVGEIFSQGIVSDELIVAAEAFVKKALSNTDASHDFFHIQRVRANAKAVATGEGLSEEQSKLLDLAALLHDVADWKYSKDEHAQQKSVQPTCPDPVCARALIAVYPFPAPDPVGCPALIPGYPSLIPSDTLGPRPVYAGPDPV